MRASLLLSVLVASLAAPAWADEACEHVMTSQLVGTCPIYRYLICANGERRADWFYAGRPQGGFVMDADLSLISLAPSGDGDDAVESRVSAIHRAFSLDELLRTGRSSGSYEVPFHYMNLTMSSMTWEAELTGQQVTSSGVTFQVARMRMTWGGPPSMSADVDERQVLIDPERRLMIAGPIIPDDKPPAIDVILPGEPGFKETNPDFCGQITE